MNIPFASFNNRYAERSCYVVGRGVTDFNYEDLASIAEPVFFINDAVCLEQYARSETFFFAHDKQMLPWLDGSIRSTAVLPIDGKLFAGSDPARLKHGGGVVYYYWREKRREQLIRMTRDELAQAEMLFTDSGTIHSLLHFVWFCGFRNITLIGCDGLPRTADPITGVIRGHDPRLENRSDSPPAPQYFKIRAVQDSIMHMLGLEARYLGTPR